ncbi:MAG: MFS transporter [Chloroflexi bacterium]|nr:MFS transporter [Chloroflexota bacterium]MBU1752175.1 MFS transporter [Chloroflexota bacterium]MBU1879161.1 MFS transporter [Chloroflexota bacterium]
MTSQVQEYTRSITDAQVGTLRTLGLAILLISLPFGILDFVLPIYGRGIGADAVQIGLFFSAFSLMTVLLRPLVGVGLDRWGRRPFLLTGLAGYATTMLAFALVSDQMWMIVVARVIQGSASAFLWLSANAIVSDSAGADDRGRSFGVVDQSSNRGAILGTIVGFAVLSSLDFNAAWQLLFIGYGAASLLAVLLAWRRLPETRAVVTRAAHRPIVWSRPWVLLLLVTLVTAASWSMTSPILMIFLQDRLAADVPDLALAFLPAALVWALLPARLGKLADRFGRKPLMVLGLVVAAGTALLIPGLSSLVGLAALWAVQALCYAAGDPAERALVADLTGNDQRGRAYGLYALAAGLGATIGPLAGGWLYETVSPGAPFYANGGVLAGCALVLWALLQEPARAGE